MPSKLSSFWLYIIILGGGLIVFLAIFIPILVCCVNTCRNVRKLKEQKEKEKNLDFSDIKQDKPDKQKTKFKSLEK